MSQFNIDEYYDEARLIDLSSFTADEREVIATAINRVWEYSLEDLIGDGLSSFVEAATPNLLHHMDFAPPEQPAGRFSVVRHAAMLMSLADGRAVHFTASYHLGRRYRRLNSLTARLSSGTRHELTIRLAGDGIAYPQPTGRPEQGMVANLARALRDAARRTPRAFDGVPTVTEVNDRLRAGEISHELLVPDLSSSNRLDLSMYQPPAELRPVYIVATGDATYQMAAADAQQIIGQALGQITTRWLRDTTPSTYVIKRLHTCARVASLLGMDNRRPANELLREAVEVRRMAQFEEPERRSQVNEAQLRWIDTGDRRELDVWREAIDGLASVIGEDDPEITERVIELSKACAEGGYVEAAYHLMLDRRAVMTELQLPIAESFPVWALLVRWTHEHGDNAELSATLADFSATFCRAVRAERIRLGGPGLSDTQAFELASDLRRLIFRMGSPELGSADQVVNHTLLFSNIAAADGEDGLAPGVPEFIGATLRALLTGQHLGEARRLTRGVVELIERHPPGPHDPARPLDNHWSDDLTQTAMLLLAREQMTHEALDLGRQTASSPASRLALAGLMTQLGRNAEGRKVLTELYADAERNHSMARHMYPPSDFAEIDTEYRRWFGRLEELRTLADPSGTEMPGVGQALSVRLFGSTQLEPQRRAEAPERPLLLPPSRDQAHLKGHKRGPEGLEPYGRSGL